MDGGEKGNQKYILDSGVTDNVIQGGKRPRPRQQRFLTEKYSSEHAPQEKGNHGIRLPGAEIDRHEEQTTAQGQPNSFPDGKNLGGQSAEEKQGKEHVGDKGEALTKKQL